MKRGPKVRGYDVDLFGAMALSDFPDEEGTEGPNAPEVLPAIMLSDFPDEEGTEAGCGTRVRHGPAG